MTLSIPSNVRTGTIQGRVIAQVPDTTDAGDEPNARPALGTVTFTATVPRVQVGSATPPVTIALPPAPYPIDADGYIVSGGSLDEDGNLVDGTWSKHVKLIATSDDMDELNPKGFAYTVSFQLTGGATIPPFALIVKPDETIDISLAMEAPDAPPETEGAAQAAATAAAISATEAAYSAAHATGPQGPPGEDGTDGVDGTDGTDGESAYELAVDGGFTGSVSEWLDSLVGPQGPQGEQGPKGEQGEQGVPGETGPKGDKGDRGPQGLQGPAGTSVTIVGTVANSASLPSSASDGDGYITDNDGHLWVWGSGGFTDVGTVRGPVGPQGVQGPQGPQGVQGDDGPQGPQGEQGPKGDQGEQGPQGPKGDKGDRGSIWRVGSGAPTFQSGDENIDHYLDGDTGDVYSCDGSEWTASGFIRGPQGEQGPQGPTGPTGDTGPQGPKGEQGMRGDPGPGVSAGGTEGQVLAKASTTDYDTTWSTLATVATSGSYGDLSGKPSIPNSPDDINAATSSQGALADTAVQPADLATVATSGSYDDLTGTPPAPTWSSITGKPAVIAAGSSQSAARSAIGAGTSDLTLGTTSSTALAGDTAVMVVVNNGASTTTARPSGAASVYWVGSAEPANAAAGDLWVGSI